MSDEFRCPHCEHDILAVGLFVDPGHGGWTQISFDTATNTFYRSYQRHPGLPQIKCGFCAAQLPYATLATLEQTFGADFSKLHEAP